MTVTFNRAVYSYSFTPVAGRPNLADPDRVGGGRRCTSMVRHHSLPIRDGYTVTPDQADTAQLKDEIGEISEGMDISTLLRLAEDGLL